jgi:acetyltransferase
VLALDARIRVAPPRVAGPAHARLAIRPYPRELEETVTAEGGRSFFVRPILPEDEPALRASFAKLTQEEIRLRFFTPMKTLPHLLAARFTQIDYDREMALVLTERGVPGRTEIYGVVRMMADPDNERAEYAILVRHDLTGLGLGTHLMQRIIELARRRGIGELWGDVLAENTRMLELCRELGFRQKRDPHDATLVRVRLDLREGETRRDGGR